MRDVILTFLVLALLVAWFSVNGPITMPAEHHGLGPGKDRIGESPLVVSGAGPEIIAEVQTGEPQDGTGQAPPENGAAITQAGDDTPREEHMDNITNLGWYVAGVVAVLIGAFTGPLVARLWQKIYNK